MTPFCGAVTENRHRRPRSKTVSARHHGPIRHRHQNGATGRSKKRGKWTTRAGGGSNRNTSSGSERERVEGGASARRRSCGMSGFAKGTNVERRGSGMLLLPGRRPVMATAWGGGQADSCGPKPLPTPPGDNIRFALSRRKSTFRLEPDQRSRTFKVEEQKNESECVATTTSSTLSGAAGIWHKKIINQKRKLIARKREHRSRATYLIPAR